MKLKLSLLFVFIISYSWSQTTQIFAVNGTFKVPAGVTSITAQGWGGGGSGGGASGAGLLLGRGGAGGGGGAYASSALSVTSGTTLSVLVASSTAGTAGANGTNGGSSTITGFESLFLAAGGSGGTANNAGGSPAGGSGGTTATSAGTTKIAGSNGGNGMSGLLSLLFSSGAGGAGANLGGAGGAAVSSIILATAPGNAGNAPGGAGSGAVNSALGVAQVGGVGAAGRVIIGYTCPTYNVTSTTASSFCASDGSTSTVTLTSSAVGLPVGNYVVTYNRSNPSATGLTANLTVSTAGTGTFTATGLTTIGSSTITITRLSSESCFSNITANNTAVVTISPATVGGSVTGGSAVTAGSTSGLLTLSGHTGLVVKWQSSVSPFTTWTDIANTNTTYTSGPLTETTQFRAVVQSGTCVAANSTAATVTVSCPYNITTTAAPDICSPDDETLVTITSSPLSLPVGNYSVNYNSSNPVIQGISGMIVTTAGTGTFIAVVGTTSGTSTITITRISSELCFSDITTNNTAVITVSPPAVAGSVTGGSTVASGSTSGLLTLSGHTGSVVKWQSSVSPFTVWTDIANTNTTYTSGALTETTQFRAVVQSGTCDVVYSTAATVTVSANPPTIDLAPIAEIVCFDDINIPKTTTLYYSITTGNPITYSIVWLNSAPLPAVTDAALSGLVVINIPAGVEGTFTGQLTVKDTDGLVSPVYNFGLIVSPIPTIDIYGQLGSVYTSNSAQTAQITYISTTGSPTSYFIDWDETANNASLADQPETANTFSTTKTELTIDISANAQAGTYAGTLVVLNEYCSGSFPISVTISNTPPPTIDLASVADVVCYDEGELNTSKETRLYYFGTTGDPVTYSIVWPPSSPFINVTDGVLELPIVIDIPAGVEGEFTGQLTVKNAGGSESAASNFSIFIQQQVTIDLPDDYQQYTVYESSEPQTTQIKYSATTGNPTTYSIDWISDEIADQDLANHVFETGNGEFTLDIAANVPAGTYNGTLTIRNNACPNSYPIVLNIEPQPQNIVSTSNTAKIGDTANSSLGNIISVASSNSVINVDSSNQNINKIFVYDVSGNLIYNKTGIGNPKLKIEDLKSSNQVLIVKVVLDNNQIETKKIIY